MKPESFNQAPRWIEEVTTIALLCDYYLRACKSDAQRDRAVSFIRHFSLPFPGLDPSQAKDANQVCQAVILKLTMPTFTDEVPF